MANKVSEKVWSRQHFIVTAFDPGKTTGYAQVRVVTNRDGHSLEVLKIGTLTKTDHLVEVLPTESVHNACIIFENFSLMSHVVDTAPLEMIGSIKAIGNLLHCPIYSQPASARMAAGKWFPDIVKQYRTHQKDALMHAIVFTSKMWQTDFDVIKLPTESDHFI